MRLRKIVATTVAAVGVAAVPAIVAAQPASAALNCTTWYSAQGYAQGKCLTGESGGNYYRVKVLCQNWFTRASRTVSGNTVHVNATYPSTVDGCGAFESYYGQPWIQTMW